MVHADGGGSRWPAVDVSVIVPVFNALPYLHETLESFLAQDLPSGQFEVIAVNDGSTDDSGAALDEFARHHANTTVIHQENSGWPGKPRNVGLDQAQGRYVFFVDADDVLGGEALRRMVEFADAHTSDAVAPKLVSLNGRRVPIAYYANTLADADLEFALGHLAPMKMFRRSMLVENGLRFLEGKVRNEDAIFVASAYCASRRVSILADYDYYFARKREDGQHISTRPLDPAGYVWSVGEICRAIREGYSDHHRANRAILDVYRRKCLNVYVPARFAGMPEAQRNQWIHEHQRLIDRYIPTNLESELPEPYRRRSQLVRAGDEAGLLALGAWERGAVLATVRRARWTSDSLELQIDAEFSTEPDEDGTELWLCLQNRGSESWEEVPIARRAEAADRPDDPQAGMATLWPCSVRVPLATLTRSSPTVIDFYVRRALEHGSRRSRLRATDIPGHRGAAEPYRTRKGNFSIRTDATRGLSQRIRRAGARLLRR